MRLNWKTIGKVAISILGFFIKRNNSNSRSEIEKIEDLANKGIEQL